MPLRILFEDVRLIEDGLWEARLRRQDNQILGPGATSEGEINVLIVTDPALRFDRHSRQLRFDLTKAHLANTGTTDSVIIINGRKKTPANLPPREARVDVERRKKTVEVRALQARDDSRYLDELEGLPNEVRSLGRELLARIRAEFSGGFKYYPKSKRYIQTPDNFWTVKIQPRDGSLRITVRGRPDLFGSVTALSIKPGMSGYSGFKIWKREQLAAALAVIRAASRH